jgi:F420H(2)-dependent quinone reductase
MQAPPGQSFDSAPGTRGRHVTGIGGPVAAHPDQVQIDAGGHKVAVTAQQLHGPERDQAWQQITTAAPRYAKDASKTDRQLPIIRLTPGLELRGARNVRPPP